MQAEGAVSPKKAGQSLIDRKTSYWQLHDRPAGPKHHMGCSLPHGRSGRCVQGPRVWLGRLAQGVTAALMVGVPGGSIVMPQDAATPQWVVADVANAEEAPSRWGSRQGPSPLSLLCRRRFITCESTEC